MTRNTMVMGLVLCCVSGVSVHAGDVALTVHPERVLNPIDEKVYGHFLEHIYHSCNGGLWGELIWNRSFELDGSGQAAWTIDGDALVQSSLATDVHLEVGVAAWGDYEVALEARKDRGSEGFLIVFRAPDEDNFYWLNLGGWGNTRHAIENEVDGRRREIGRSVRGRIETGRWYSIRIRCEGNRYQIWLDAERILDLTDRNAAHPTGKIGVGTWATQARYRNIRVTDLDAGTELYRGLPDLPSSPTFRAEHWTLFGAGQASLAKDALNDDLSVQIVSNGSKTGLQQGNFAFKRQLYTGSLWMKGAVPNGLTVELLDGPAVIGQAHLAAPASTWTEYPFRITPSAAPDDGSLRITLQGAGSVKIDQVSLMGQDARDTGGYRPDLLAAVRALRAPVIRWPGGCFASLYLWKDGIGPQHKRRQYAAHMWEDQDTNSYGTDEFIRMCQKIGSEPLLVINTGILDSACGGVAQFKLPSPQDYLPYALDWMEYCNGDAKTTKWGALRAANGHPEPYNVTYWEIDNETWAAGVSDYIAAVRTFAPALRAKADELGVPIVLLACGGSRFDMNWNRALIDACAELFDFISVHNYENPNNFATGVTRYEEFLVTLGKTITASDNPAMKIYNSEWNAQSTDWRTGLYAGGLLNAYERQGGMFRIGGPALFLRHTSAGAWDNAFINFDHTGWFPAPNYVVMKLWREHYAPQRIDLQGDAGDLNLVATKSADGRTVFIKAVNPTQETVNVTATLTGSTIGQASMHLIAPGTVNARNTLSRPDTVKPKSQSVTQEGQTVRFTLVPISCGVVEIPLNP